MREIKFRGKRINNGEWVYGSYVKLEDTESDQYGEEFFGVTKHYIQEHAHYDYSIDYLHEVDPSTVVQYTGLKDKVGAEIFEGDVIKSIHNFYYAFGEERGYTKEGSDQGNWLITYEGMGFTGLPISDKCIGSALTPQKDFANVEVIGNIHDNAELLQGGDGNE